MMCNETYLPFVNFLSVTLHICIVVWQYKKIRKESSADLRFYSLQAYEILAFTETE